MGLFTSHCPYCSGEIDWFLTPPDNYICKCGKPVTADEIKKSWDEIYRERIKEFKSSCSK